MHRYIFHLPEKSISNEISSSIKRRLDIAVLLEGGLSVAIAVFFITSKKKYFIGKGPEKSWKNLNNFSLRELFYLGG
jgi:hypothetical protein